MKYTAFRRNALEQLTRYGKDKGFALRGKYRGKEYDHILLDLKDNIINQGFQDFLYGLLDENEWHTYSKHLNSSQALAINLLGPLCLKMQWSAILGVGPKVEQVIHHEFEYCDSEASDDDGTEFDFYLSDGAIKVYFEVKYTERTLHTKSNPKDKDRLWNIHLPALKGMFIDELSEDNYFAQYQLWRNILKIVNDNSYVYFIIPEKREDLKAEITDAIHKLKDRYREKVHIRYIEEVCKAVDCQDLTLKKHYGEFTNKYLF